MIPANNSLCDFEAELIIRYSWKYRTVARGWQESYILKSNFLQKIVSSHKIFPHYAIKYDEH